MDDWKAGNYGKAIGRASFEVSSAFFGTKGVAKLATLGRSDDIRRLGILSKGDDASRAGHSGPSLSSLQTQQSARFAARADELHSALDPIARTRRTTAVMGTREGVDVLAGGARDLAPTQRTLAGSGDVLGRFQGDHPEITALKAPGEAGLTPQGLAATTNICPACRNRARGGRSYYHRSEIGVVVVVQVTGPALRNDEAQLVGELAALSPAARATFAAACAERMLPIYRWFHERTGRGDPAALEHALGALWAALGGGDSAGLNKQRDVAEGLVPYEDDSWVDDCAFAQNAAASVAYAIRCQLTGGAQEAAWAARQLYEALDLWVTTPDNLDLNVGDAEEHLAIHPLIQAELNRQRRDLDELVTADDQAPELVSRMKDRARTEGAGLFGLDA